MLTIRRWQPEDEPAVFDLHNRSLHAVDAHAGNGRWDDDLHAVPAVYLEAGGEFLVGLLEDEIVAMGALRQIDDGTAEVTRMRVDPAHWRRGFGRAMLEALEARAAELDYRRLVLGTTSGQTAAQRLYEQAGYTRCGTSRHGRFTVLHYEKRLAPG